jgi:hypothetical protein
LREGCSYHAHVSNPDPESKPTDGSDRNSTTPVRGPLSLLPSLSSPTLVAGSDFSIFVTIQNPFDVPVTLYEVQTHLPVELLDVNQARLKLAIDAEHGETDKSRTPASTWRTKRRALLESQTGYASAVGTGFSPDTAADLVRATVNVQDVAEGGTVTGVAFNFPENPTADELDAIMRRWYDFKSGLVPIRLEPGDRIVRQFRLRTRRWLFFTPLTHTFQIQAYFSVDGSDHNCTVTYPVTIRARMAAVVIGGITGSIVGATLKLLTATPPGSAGAAIQAATVALLATLAVVVGFARKSGSQSFVSVEDFWGGGLIGFSVGFVGYSQFLDLFQPTA